MRSIKHLVCFRYFCSSWLFCCQQNTTEWYSHRPFTRWCLFIRLLCCSSRTHDVLMLICVVFQIYVTFPPQRKSILFLRFIWPMFCTFRSRRKSLIFVNISKLIPPEKCFIWKKGRKHHTSLSTQQCDRCIFNRVPHLCNVALTNICTLKKLQESSLTLCRP